MTYFIEYAYVNAKGNLSTDKVNRSVFSNALSQWATWYANFIKMTDVKGFCLGIFCSDGTEPANRGWTYYECPDYVAPEETTETE